jgi:hypothetical protein
VKAKGRVVLGSIIAIAAMWTAGCSGGNGLLTQGSSSSTENSSIDLSSIKLATKGKGGKGGGSATPNLVGTWEGTWTSTIPSGSTAPDAGTVQLVVTQQSGKTFQADIAVYDPARGETISHHLDNGSINKNKVSFKGVRSVQVQNVTLTINVNFSGTVNGTQVSGSYTGFLVTGKGKGKKSEQDTGTWVVTKK